MSMSSFESLAGKILVAQPKNQSSHFAKSVILLAQHGINGAWGVMVNKEASSVDIKTVMSAAGINYPGHAPVYIGGPVNLQEYISCILWIGSVTVHYRLHLT